MSRKEWREVGQQSLYFVLAVAGILLLAFLGDRWQGQPFDGEKAAIMLGLWLLMFSLFMGLTPFAMDSKQKGMEYLLTLPLSRRRLLWIKFWPRLAAVILFCLAFAVFYRLAGRDAFGGGFAIFILAYFALFLISFSLSVAHENFVVQSIWAGVALSGYLALCLLVCTLGFSWKFGMPSSWAGIRIWKELSYDVRTLLVSIAVFLLLAAPFNVSFFLAFKKFDLRPARAFNRRQLLLFVPMLLLAFAVSLGLTYLVQRNSPGESHLFALNEQRLLKADFSGKLTLFSEAGRRRVDTKSRISWERLLLEQGERVYVSGYEITTGDRIIGCLNQADFSWKIVHRIPGRYFVAYGYIGIRYDGTHFVYMRSDAHEIKGPGAGRWPEDGFSELELVRVDPVSGESQTILFQTPLFKNYNEPWFLGSDERLGRRFWLVDLRRCNILRLWDDGHVEDLGVSRGKPAYFGGLLFSHGAHSLLVRRLLDATAGSENLKEIEGKFKSFSLNLSLPVSKPVAEIYAVRDERIVLIDLATLTVGDIGPACGHILMMPTGDFYYVEFESWPGQLADKWKRLYRLKGGRMIFLKQFDFKEAEYGHLIVSANGVELFLLPVKGGKEAKATRRFFAFPDLRELRFKGLD